MGRETVRELKKRGHWVRAIGRSAERLAGLGADETTAVDARKPASLGSAMQGIQVVFSCAGQTVSPKFVSLRPGFKAADIPITRNLVDAAKAASVRRFVYVSVLRADEFPGNAYLRAHAEAAKYVRGSGLSWAVLEPTGFFSAYREILEMARKDRAILFGDGMARTNPIDDRDLALLAAGAVESSENRRIPAGGPFVITRREIVEMAYRVLNRPDRVLNLPGFLPSLAGGLMWPLAPRMGELMQFVGLISSTDFVAPKAGSRSLEDYFRAAAFDRKP